MGSYNSQYESYYSSLVNKRRNQGGYTSYGNKRKGLPLIEGNFLIRRITIDLIGVFILFVFVISCKLIPAPQTVAAYKYSKKIINENYDYNAVLANVKEFDIKKVNLSIYEEKFTNYMDSIKAKLTGGKTLKGELQTSYILPLDETILIRYKKSGDGIDMEAKESSSIVSSFNGRVKDCGENEKIGKFIVIDHGNGIETKYGNLSEVSIKKDTIVKTGEVIGKSGIMGKDNSSHLYFELLYMGENKNPEEYLSFIKK